MSGGTSFSALAAGGGHTCGLTSAGAAYCWGTNDDGQLGNGALVYPFASPVAVSGSTSFSALAAGNGHTCALTSAGAAYCWGWNYLGQLGRGTLEYSTVPVAVAPVGASAPASGVRTPTSSVDGRQIAFGSNRDGSFEIYVMNADGTPVPTGTGRSRPAP